MGEGPMFRDRVRDDLRGGIHAGRRREGSPRPHRALSGTSCHVAKLYHRRWVGDAAWHRILRQGDEACSPPRRSSRRRTSLCRKRRFPCSPAMSCRRRTSVRAPRRSYRRQLMHDRGLKATLVLLLQW